MRDNFSPKDKDTLAKRVGCRCSNPQCTCPTSGPHTEVNKSVNLGVAAHITAAKKGGPRYNPLLTPKQRKSIENGIWLCQTCAKLIDSDEARFPVELLNEWKTEAEMQAKIELESPCLFTARQDLVSISDHREPATETQVNLSSCKRYGAAVAPLWLALNPSRLGSNWLVKRLLNNADLQLFLDPNWDDGIYFVADMKSRKGVVLNKQQFDELKQLSTTTTTTAPPNPRAFNGNVDVQIDEWLRFSR